MDDDAMRFPRERPGLDYALNWSLNGDGVTPYGDAYRITKKAMAEEMLKGSPVPEASGPAKAAPEFDDEEAYEAAFEQSVLLLEAAPVLYAADGDVRGTRVPCRVISPDLPLAAAAMTHCLDRMPLREPTELPVTVYLTPAGADAALLYFPKDTEAKVILSGKHATPNEISASITKAADELTTMKNEDEGEA